MRETDREMAYIVNLEQGTFLMGVKSGEAEVILVDGGGLETILGRIPIGDFIGTSFYTSSGTYHEYQVLDYGKKIPSAS